MLRKRPQPKTVHPHVGLLAGPRPAGGQVNADVGRAIGTRGCVFLRFSWIERGTSTVSVGEDYKVGCKEMNEPPCYECL